MKLINKATKIEQVITLSHDLKITLDSLLQKIESIKGDLNLDKIFATIGQELQNIKISTVISIIDDKKENMIVRYFKLKDGRQENLFEAEIQKIKIVKLNWHQQVFNKKQTIFCQNRISQLKKGLPRLKSFLDKIEESNSIISPLILKDEVIGILEIFSNNITEKNIDLVKHFSKNLSLSISNTILFQEIKKSEERYRELWDNAPVAYHVLDTKGIIRKVNKTEAKMLGYPPELMIGKSIFEFILPEQRAEARERFRLKISGQKIPKKENRIYIKQNNSKIYVSIDDVLEHNNSGKIVGIRTTMIDITERKQAEKALRESEKKYRKLVDNANDGVIIINTKGYITFANKAFSKISGYDKKDLTRLHISKLIHPNDYNTIIKRFNKRLSGKKISPSYEFKGIDKKGRIKHFSISDTPIIENGKVVGLQEIFKDITDKKRLQKKIEQAKEYYEQVIDTIQDGICVIDKNFKIVSCNKEFVKHINLPFSQTKGKKCKEVIPHYKNELFKNHCTHMMRGNGCLVDKAFAEGKKLSFTEKNLDNLGKAFYHRINIFPAKNSKGEVYQIVLVVEDATERKMAEEEIGRLHEFNKRVLDNAPVSIIVLDKKGKITSTNKHIKTLSKSTNLVGKDIFTIPFSQRENLVHQYKELLQTGKSFAKLNCQTTNKRGQIKYLNIIAVPLKNKNGNIDGAISMAIDSTETVLAKQKLEELNRNLEKKVIQRTQQLDRINKQLNKVLELKSKFISDASHELRTPLTVIQGNLDLATRETKNLNNTTPEVFDLINKEIKQMSGILTDLTMLTNSDSQTEKLAYEKVDLVQLIKAISQSLEILARQKKIKIKYKQKLKQLTIMGDEAKVEKLLLNIARNAIKYNKKGGWVKIWTEKNNNGVNIYVEDNGIGIPKQDLPYIFERFYRVDKARSRGEGGTGLGLSIAKWIAEAHQGKISAESTMGKGSKFIIHLPNDYKKQKEKVSLFG